MHHKRGRPKTSRAGCLMCKPNKMGRGREKVLGHKGFAAIRAARHSEKDLIEHETEITELDRGSAD